MRNIAHFMGKHGVTAALLAVFALAPIGAYAQTIDVAALIAQLQAQIASLQAQIQALQVGPPSDVPPLPPLPPPGPPPMPGPSVCPNLPRSLYLGLRGDDVSGLQQFLRSQGYFTYSTNTGYFGPSTERAVQDFQAKRDIVSSGGPETTGFGVVGKQTREAIAKECGGVPPEPPPIPPLTMINLQITPTQVAIGNTYTFNGSLTGAFPNAPVYFFLERPNGSMKLSHYYIGTTDSNGSFSSQTTQIITGGQEGRYTAWVYVNPDGASAQRSNVVYFYLYSVDQRTNYPPVISGVSGPTSLKVGEQVTWTVSAYDTNIGKGILSYSVIWGDEQLGIAASQAAAPSWIPSIQQTATFSHVYSRESSPPVRVGV